MKRKMIIGLLGMLLLCVPVGLSVCDCEDDDAVQLDSTYEPMVTTFDIQALQEQAVREGWTFTVGENSATSRPLNLLCGLVEPENWWVDAEFDPCLPTRDLPEKFDWRELGGVPEIRDQASCGSCWAFGTLGPLECNILIKDKIEVDLSEQWLVSCNRDDWGCNGGWWAHDYIEWKTDSCGGTGAVLEEDFPYTAHDIPCGCPYNHPYLIDDWKYIGSSQGVPSVSAMKQAILDHGPISVAVAVNNAFSAYSGGIFSGPTSYNVNHAVTLVGWDDSLGSQGVWILRNSWGPDWGEDGYMYIQYGICKVGYAACYVDYPGSSTQLNVNITSGRGVTIGIENIGAFSATQVYCNISIRGGFLGFLSISKSVSILDIPSVSIVPERIPIFGLGPIIINVTAEAFNAPQVAADVKGFMFFNYVLLT